MRRAFGTGTDRERGSAALVYVLMLGFVLAAAVPLLLSLTSNSTLSALTSRNEKLASGLAIGGMEAVLAYLRAYPEEEEGTENGVPRDDYLAAYPGFVTRSFETPEGVPVTYSATLTTAGPSRYIVRIKGEAGAGSAKREKTVEYMFAPTGPARLEIVTDDGERIEVTVGQGGLYVGTDSGYGEDESGGSVIDRESQPVTPEFLDELQEAISEALDYYRYEANEIYADNYQTYYSQAQDAVCPVIWNAVNCVLQESWNHIIDNLPDPPVVKIPADNYWDTIHATLGSPEKPAVLFFENQPTFNNLNLTVYGTVIFPQGVTSHGMNLTVIGGDVVFGTGISPTGVFNVTTVKVNGEGGNFVVLGGFAPANAPVLNIAGNFYAGYVQLNNPSSIVIGGKMIVSGGLNFQNIMQNFAIGQDLLIGSLTTCCFNRIDTGGDILIEGGIDRNGSLELNAGGNIGVGEGIPDAPWHPVVVQTGGGTTSLIVPKVPGDGDGGGDGGGSGGGGGSWNPVRLS